MKKYRHLFFPLVFLASLLPAAVAQTTPDTPAVKRAKAYAETIEKFVERAKKPHLVIADVSDYNNSEKPVWKSYASEEEFEKSGAESYMTAYIWKKDGRVVQVNTTYSSPSGDWAEFYFQTYRADGSLARVDRELRTFLGDIIVNRIRFYDEQGGLLKETETYRDLQTRKPVAPTDDYQDVEAGEIYLRTKDQPFAALMGLGKDDQTAGFVPVGWTEEARTEGDLNGDARPDAVVQLRKENAEDDDYDRRLLIWFRQSGGGYTKAAESRKILRCTVCGGVLGGGPADIEIKKGVLTISQMYGSRQATQYLHRFRFEPKTGRFRLIGEDITNYDRATGTSETVSTNYLTGRQITSKMRYDQKTDREVTVSSRTKRVPRTRRYLEEIDYGNY